MSKASRIKLLHDKERFIKTTEANQHIIKQLNAMPRLTEVARGIKIAIRG